MMEKGYSRPVEAQEKQGQEDRGRNTVSSSTMVMAAAGLNEHRGEGTSASSPLPG